jgi:hypothetical protein
LQTKKALVSFVPWANKCFFSFFFCLPGKKFTLEHAGFAFPTVEFFVGRSSCQAPPAPSSAPNYLENFPSSRKGQDCDSYQEISDGQRHNEEIRDRPQFGRTENCGYDQTIADYDHDINEGQHRQRKEQLRFTPIDSFQKCRTRGRV